MRASQELDRLKTRAAELRREGKSRRQIKEIHLGFRVYIHENADAKAAELFWLEATGAKPEQFLTPTLKRHNPKTVRKNVGETYHGCLRIDVRRSSDLYHKIEGWTEEIMSGG